MAGIGSARRLALTGGAKYSVEGATTSVPVLDEAAGPVRMEQRHGAEGPDQCRVRAERLPPGAALGHQRADDDGFGLHAADQARAEASEAPVETTSSTTVMRAATDGADPGRVHTQPLRLVGGD